ncbi:MAG: hypothetical protein A2289_26380 [Deltaproteobacteria bacterium RIFOXYA12_FULL_58_15]|nr:MAG: hypothetical protein A2289_26380 [Deltaproteobacteria bacterium RIFOXYA12_FULL_58_15]
MPLAAVFGTKGVQVYKKTTLLSSAVSLLLTTVAGAAEVPSHLTITIGGRRHELHRRQEVAGRAAKPTSIKGVAMRPLGHPQQLGAELPVFGRLLVIVTTEDLGRASAVLPEYIDWRVAGGWQVVVGLEHDWDQPSLRDGDDRQARIRAWLKKVYAAHGSGYLLLIGDPHPDHRGVPMRRMEPMAHFPGVGLVDPTLSHVPTDFYYSDLESDWDCDGDGVFGEYPDDDGWGCADWGPELITGRIPVYGGADELDPVLTAILAYEQASDKSYRDQALFAGAFAGFRGPWRPS